MYEYIKGLLISASPQQAVIETGGLGYALFITPTTFEKLPNPGNEIKLFVSVVIREDSHKLFAFYSHDERDFFESLTEISGIGPRLGLAILGHMSIEDLHGAVEHENTKAISAVPGIGKKMAQRLILELRDRFAKMGKEQMIKAPSGQSSLSSDAISALTNLGYHPLEAQKSVKTILAKSDNELSLSSLISEALKTVK